MISLQTKITRTAIVAALTMGEATTREIEHRIGMVPATATIQHLHALARQGVVYVVRKEPPKNGGGNWRYVWALTEIGAVRASAEAA